MGYDPQATAGFVQQDASALLALHIVGAAPASQVGTPDAGSLVGPHAGFTVLAVTQTQMVDRAGNLIDALDISFRLDARGGVFTYSAPADFYSFSSPLAGVAALAQTIEAIYEIGSDSQPSSIAPSSPPPSPYPFLPPDVTPPSTASPQPPPRTFTPL